MAAGKQFFGCSKCRWSRAGCIWWKCNSEKFRAHMEKFPENYSKDSTGAQTKELKTEVAKKLSNKELVEMVRESGVSAASSSKGAAP